MGTIKTKEYSKTKNEKYYSNVEKIKTKY